MHKKTLKGTIFPDPENISSEFNNVKTRKVRIQHENLKTRKLALGGNLIYLGEKNILKTGIPFLKSRKYFFKYQMILKQESLESSKKILKLENLLLDKFLLILVRKIFSRKYPFSNQENISSSIK